MNFLIPPDAEQLLAQDDYRRLWLFFANTKVAQRTQPPLWLTETVKTQYRAVWGAGLHGGCNLYRASPCGAPGRRFGGGRGGFAPRHAHRQHTDPGGLGPGRRRPASGLDRGLGRLPGSVDSPHRAECQPLDRA